MDYTKSISKTEIPLLNDWLEVSANAMEAFQILQNRYQFPLKGYGYFVCNDSVALALSKWQDLTGLSQSSISHAFPLVRAETVGDFDVLGDLLSLMNLNASTLEALYPSDPSLQLTDPQRLKKRLEITFDKETLEKRLSAFPELYSKLQEIF